MKDRTLYAWLLAIVSAAIILVSTREPEIPAEAYYSPVQPTVHVPGTLTAPAQPDPVLTAVNPCDEVLGFAILAGWPEELHAQLLEIVWRESRCLAHVHNPDDPRGGSHGLLQINGFWCRPNPNTGWPIGWLQHHGIIHSCDDLYDPYTNLRAGLAIWSNSGWHPWATFDGTDE